MLCPFCQQSTDTFPPADDGHAGLKCPVCAEEGVPRLYPVDYDLHPAVPVSIFGPTGAGKTVFIDALITHLEERVEWPSFSCQWMDQAGMLRSRERLRLLREHGQLPDATEKVFPRPEVVRLRGIPRVGGCQLLFYDTSGETFRDVELLRDAGRYVRHSPAVLWLISLVDIEYPQQLTDLMTTYAEAMSEMGGNPRTQSMIVVLTKGDLLIDRPDLPPEAKEFLLNDNLNPGGDAWAVLDRLSTALEGWLRKSPHRNVVNVLKDQFRAVRFCVISAQGGPAPEDNRLAAGLMPRGVLAPLFWLWRETLPVIWVEVGNRRAPFFSLAQAVEVAPAGATIRVGHGTHLLPTKLNLRRSVRVVGPGPDQAILWSTADGYVVGIATPGEVTLSGLTVMHGGEEPADVVRVLQGSAVLDRCAVRGGAARSPDVPGAGVVADRDAAVSLTNCTVEQNAGNGVESRGQSRLTMTDTATRQNGLSGVAAGGAGADLTRVEAAENGEHGVRLTARVKGSVQGSRCRRNTKSGIAAFLDTAAELVENTCDENELDGIVLKDRVTATARGNTCHRNKQAGISIHDTVSGTVSGNRCSENKLAGIEVEDDAAPEVRENHCTENRGAGIAYTDSAGGVCEGNRCLSNRADGIVVAGKARPAVDGNTCSDNGAVGLRVAATAAPTVGKGNTARDNARGDFDPPRLGKRGWLG